MQTKIPQMPQTLFAILKYAKIKREDVAGIDEKEIIRIEKKLKAAQKLHQQISMDAVEKTIDALKNNLTQIKYCYADELLYHLFHRIRFKEFEFLAFYYLQKEPLVQMQLFFSKYLEDDLQEEFKLLVNNKGFKELVRWQLIENLFSIFFKHTFHQLLMAKLHLILQTLQQKPSSWQMKSKISFATKGQFYKLLSAAEDPECEKVLYQILRFYSENGTYTKGHDFADSILVAMYDYKTKDIRLGLSITSTAMAYGGSNKVAVIAVASIFAFFGLIILFTWLHHERTYRPKAFVPKDTWEMRIYMDDIKEINNSRQRQTRLCADTNCEQAFKYSDVLVLFESATSRSFPYTYSADNTLITGENIFKSGKYIYPISKNKNNMYVVNNTNQPMLLMVYIASCYYQKWEGYFPCKFPIAYNKVYVKPNDTLALDYHFDSLAIQTGKNLYKLNHNYGDTKQIYAFCPITEIDSMLYNFTFGNKSSVRTIDGILSVSKSYDTYIVRWNGQSQALYDKSHSYISNVKPIFFSLPKKNQYSK